MSTYVQRTKSYKTRKNWKKMCRLKKRSSNQCLVTYRKLNPANKKKIANMYKDNVLKCVASAENRLKNHQSNVYYVCTEN